jgi:hypothetical protein
MTITSLDQVTEFPLCWPPEKPRTSQRQRSPFTVTLAKAHREIQEELPRWGSRHWVVSMAPAYRQGLIDPGVAVWFNVPAREKGQPPELRVIACDRFPDRPDNLHAIALTLDRLRSMERYGTYSLWQALEGARPMLPPPARAHQERPWWDVLGANREWPLPAIEGMYRSAVRGASEEKLLALNLAIESARKEKGEG